MLAVDLVIPPKSGKIPINSFCVEQSRWQKRGDESVQFFAQAGGRVIGKGMKGAVRGNAVGQGNVWGNVIHNQSALSKNLNVNVRSAKSSTSMQLTLENKKLKEEAKTYVDKLKGSIDTVPGAIGYAFVVNGEFSSCDLYGSNKMFKKLWPRMLDACVHEAIAEYDKKKEGAKPNNKWMSALFIDGHVGNIGKEEKISPHVSAGRRDMKGFVFNGTRDLRSNKVIHRSFDVVDPNAPKGLQQQAVPGNGRSNQRIPRRQQEQQKK